MCSGVTRSVQEVSNAGVFEACAGHFAALEKPELLMADMRAFFATYH